MGTVSSTYVFESDTETVTRTKLNNLVADLLTEFNGQIDNDNIKAGAGILASKLDLASPGIIGNTTPAAATFTTLTASSLSVSDGTGPIPVGGIILWSGAISAIPTGWGLCDGSTYGTVVSPDLSESFVIHADADSGGSFAPGDTGGSTTIAEANLPAHGHGVSSITTSDPGNHTHSYTYGNIQAQNRDTQYAAQWASSYTGGTTGGAGSHTHTLSGTTDTVGSGTDYYQPYYALAYIIKHDG
jgi:hypothetical protein